MIYDLKQTAFYLIENVLNSPDYLSSYTKMLQDNAHLQNMILSKHKEDFSTNIPEYWTIERI